MEKFRLIKIKEFDAFTNMALDEAISEFVKEGKSLPTIRFYKWKPSAISIGYFQGLKNEVNLEECKKQGVDVVRRRTGGGAVYHDDEITYSIIGKQELFSADIIKSYEEICNYIVKALAKIGIEAQFSPINDVLADGKKISGSAQTRRNGVLLQHGTVLFKVDVDKMFSLLKVGKEKIADKLIKSVKKRVTSVSDISDATEEQLINALEESFSEGKEIIVEDYTKEELERAEELKEKYKSEEWNNMR